MILTRKSRPRSAFAALIGVLLLVACAAPPPTLPPPPAQRPADQYLASPRLAARHAALAVAEQLKHPGITRIATVSSSPLWVMPAINRHSGEITASGRELQVLMALDLQRALGEQALVRSSVDGPVAAGRSQWVLQALVEFQRPDAGHQHQGAFRVDVAVSSTSGKALPGLRMHINPQQFDPTPSRFFRDAPMFLTGRHHQQRLALAEQLKQGTQPTADPLPLMAIEARLQQGISAYEDELYTQALDHFSAVLELDSENLPALSGRYQTLLAQQPERIPDDELQALIRTALAQDSLNFRFLFKVSSLEFRDDIDIAKQYATWIRGIASATLASGQCLRIVGHASRSGSEAVNLKLSLARAQRVMQQLLRQSPNLKGRLMAEGRGFADNLVGSGSDDVVDAIDRRVEFSRRPCH